MTEGDRQGSEYVTKRFKLGKVNFEHVKNQGRYPYDVRID